MNQHSDETHQYFLAAKRKYDEISITLQKISETGIEVLSESKEKYSKPEIRLKVDSKGTHFNFYYGTESNNWKPLLDNVDARYLSTANSYGFTGTTVGMYATKQKY